MNKHGLYGVEHGKFVIIIAEAIDDYGRPAVVKDLTVRPFFPRNTHKSGPLDAACQP